MVNHRHPRFHLDPASGVPFYRQIIDQVLAAIATGGLGIGDQLPTVRQLAVDLAVNFNTVARAYKELEIRGVVTTQQGTGTFVAEQDVSVDDLERRRQLNQLLDEMLAKAARQGLTLEEIREALSERGGGS
jgi:GntR family transcriptional regulator